ncbi:MAG TPA: hypothetical protein VLD19_08240 [Chitinophagaceae bacterium]|nr:hypothetical protein [Chitinophagaceae bacterium]
MVLVFKTNVTSKKSVKKLRPLLDILLLRSKWNFDMKDCDKILRVEGEGVMPLPIVALLAENGFYCEEL